MLNNDNSGSFFVFAVRINLDLSSLLRLHTHAVPPLLPVLLGLQTPRISDGELVHMPHTVSGQFVGVCTECTV